MSYQVISRKYRPQSFAEVVGQEHICTILQNALRSGRIAHAYLFTGSRGIGKTSTARILAKTLNCTNPQNFNPCNQCTNCQEITSGRSLDVIEIDGASNRGIDQIRDLRENVKYPPSSGKYRIFIIDEVHMLTKEAFNALLKTLEEPPAHVIFIFATTEPMKVPATIISRCQRYDFHRIPVQQIVALLQKIVQAEGLNISEDILTLIARKADGALRDAESLLEQVIAFSADQQDFSTYQRILGLVDYDYHFKIGRLILGHDLPGLIQIASEIFDNGVDINEFFASLLEHWRNLLIARMTGSVQMLDLPASIQQQYATEAQHWSAGDLLRFIKLIGDAQTNLRYALNARIHLEFTLLRMGAMDKTVDIQQLLETLKTVSARPIPSTPTPGKSSLDLFAQKTTITSGSKSATLLGQQTKISTEHSPAITKDQQPQYKTNSTPVESPAPVSPSSVTLDKIIEEWENIILQVESENQSLANFLRQGKPIRLMNTVLEIGFSLADDFARSAITNRAKAVESVLQAIFNAPLKIRCIQIKDDSKREVKKRPIDELTSAARELFDGEIIK